MKHSWLAVFLAACGCSTLSAQAVGISYVYGNGQMGAQLTTIAPIVVFVYDKDNKPVPNSPVTWTVTQGSPNYTPPPPQITLSDANGYASSFIPAFAVDPSQSFTLVEVDARGVAGGPVKFLFNSLATTYTTEVLSPAEDANRTINASAGAVLRNAYQVSILAADGPQTGQPIPNVGLRIQNVMPGLNTSGFYDYTIGNDPKLPSATCINNTLSDANGTATCDLQIGPRAGSTQLYVLVGENRLMPVLTLNVALGPPASFTITSGNNQTGKPGERLATALRVHAADAGGNATPNAAITWSVIAGNATLGAASTKTDTSGDSTNSVTFGSTPGPVRVHAQLATNLAVDFDLTAVLGVSSLRVLSGDNQSALTGAAFTTPLAVQATDANGAPVVGIPVAFAITSGTGTLSAASANTNLSGIASINATAGADPGTMTVTATAQGVQAVFQKLVVWPPGPRLDTSSILNAASFEPGLTPCGLAVLKGGGLAPGVDGEIRALDSTVTTLGPVDSITIGGTPAFIRAVANVEGQESITIQTPCSTATGPSDVTASIQGSTVTASSVPVNVTQPGVFEVTDNSASNQKIGWAAHGDGSAVNSSSRAGRGEVIRVFATGLGAFGDAQNPGEQALTTNLILGINDAGVPLVRSGYLTNQPGLYFVEVAIPSDFPVTSNTARFVIAVPPSAATGDTIYSNTVAIPVR